MSIETSATFSTGQRVIVHNEWTGTIVRIHEWDAYLDDRRYLVAMDDGTSTTWNGKSLSALS